MRKLSVVIVLLPVAGLLSAPTGLITTAAGNGTSGTVGGGGPAVNASLNAGGVCVDSSNNFYIADWQNNRVLMVAAGTGILTLVAGNGSASSGGDGGPAQQASLNHPVGIAVDATGNLFIAEAGANRVRRVDAASQMITTVAGTGAAGFSRDWGAAVNAGLSLP